MKLISQGQEVNLPFVSVTDRVYDEEERVVGSWFGKPLYRKCVEGITNSYTNGWTEITSIDNIQKICSIKGIIHESLTPAELGFPNPYVSAGLINENKIAIYVANSSFANENFLLVIEYTKITDS